MFLFFAKNKHYGYTLEQLHRGGSNEYTLCFGAKIRKNSYTPSYPRFNVENWDSKVYTLHGHVFLMLV